MAGDELTEGPDGADEGPASQRELVVIVSPGAEVRARPDGPESLAGAEVGGVRDILDQHDATMSTLFGASESRLHALSESVAAASGQDVPDLAIFYQIEAPDELLDELADALREQEIVEAAYVKPGAQPPANILGEDIEASLDAPPDHTPDFTARQEYLDAAPGGIDARWAWTQSGGRGSRVRIIDVEGAWRWTHEDLRQNQGGTAGGTDSNDLRWRNHGSNVVGVLGGDRNAFGVTGIVTDAHVRGVSIFGAGMNSARAIERAAELLSPGDLLLIELHRPGPRFNYENRPDQRGFIPVEWWDDDFAAIRFAVARGVVVVEAAGNGAEDLDDALYQTRPPGFRTGWTNPFRRSNRDSGAILVGAGAPPPGTHGRNHGPDRSRLAFSNWGASVDAQGWGREVTTTGGLRDQAGDLQGGLNEDEWYTDQFSGTSSASPVVVGALASVQGALRARGRIPLTPARSRELLRATGSSQQDAPGRPATQRIGRRPDLRQLIPAATRMVNPWTGVQFTGSLTANQTRCWFTFNWPAHWHVVWTVIPTTPRVGGPQIRWRVRVERASDSRITYWICITNLTGHPVNVEGRYGVLGW